MDEIGASIELWPKRPQKGLEASTARASGKRRRLAFIVSHPIQYFVPLYQRLARRDDAAIKVFFTWHAGEKPVRDSGFGIPVAWDIPLTAGYEFELVPNSASDPGTHHFLGLRNPTLVPRVTAWRPDIVVIHGWAWLSHLQALHAFHKRKIHSLFRGDSHLLDAKLSGPRWWAKRAVLRRVFSWPEGFLVVGSANRAYYKTFEVPEDRLYPCPHSIEVARFAEPAAAYEAAAAQWRQELEILQDQPVLLFAGKFERKKRPLALMRAVQRLNNPRAVLVMVGGGELQTEIDAIAARDPGRFRVLPFQNQTRMPTVYRLGDVFILPSEYNETWGLAINEALSCGRPVVVSNRVGCAADVVDPKCGRVFPWNDLSMMTKLLEEIIGDPQRLMQMRRAATERAWLFDIAVTGEALMEAVSRVCEP